MTVEGAVWIIALNTLITELEELRQEIRKLQGDKSFDWDDFDWNKLL